MSIQFAPRQPKASPRTSMKLNLDDGLVVGGDEKAYVTGQRERTAIEQANQVRAEVLPHYYERILTTEAPDGTLVRVTADLIDGGGQLASVVAAEKAAAEATRKRQNASRRVAAKKGSTSEPKRQRSVLTTDQIDAMIRATTGFQGKITHIMRATMREVLVHKGQVAAYTG